MINAADKFKTFIETLKTEDNRVFVESIQEGFNICFEEESATNPDGSPKDTLQSSEQITQAIEQTKREGEVLNKLNTEQKDVENVKSELEDLNKADETKPIAPVV